MPKLWVRETDAQFFEERGMAKTCDKAKILSEGHLAQKVALIQPSCKVRPFPCWLFESSIPQLQVMQRVVESENGQGIKMSSVVNNRGDARATGFFILRLMEKHGAVQIVSTGGRGAALLFLTPYGRKCLEELKNAAA